MAAGLAGGFTALLTGVSLLGRSDAGLPTSARTHDAPTSIAGDGGSLVVRELMTSQDARYKILGFVDDDPRKQRMRVQGYPVLGGYGSLASLVISGVVDAVVISARIIEVERLRELEALCDEHGVSLARLHVGLESSSSAMTSRPPARSPRPCEKPCPDSAPPGNIRHLGYSCQRLTRVTPRGFLTSPARVGFFASKIHPEATSTLLASIAYLAFTMRAYGRIGRVPMWARPRRMPSRRVVVGGLPCAGQRPI